MNDSFESYSFLVKKLFDMNVDKIHPNVHQNHSDVDQFDQDFNRIMRDLNNIHQDKYVDISADHSDCKNCQHQADCKNGNISITVQDSLDKSKNFHVNSDVAFIYHRNKYITGINTTSMDFVDLLHALKSILDFYAEHVNVDMPLFFSHYLDNMNFD